MRFWWLLTLEKQNEMKTGKKTNDVSLYHHSDLCYVLWLDSLVSLCIGLNLQRMSLVFRLVRYYLVHDLNLMVLTCTLTALTWKLTEVVRFDLGPDLKLVSLILGNIGFGLWPDLEMVLTWNLWTFVGLKLESDLGIETCFTLTCNVLVLTFILSSFHLEHNLGLGLGLKTYL